MASIVWLLGAGTSAPFGIPTMQQMVVEFEKELVAKGSATQVSLYNEISGFLKNNLGRPVDLEVVFTIVDSFVHWSPDRLGIAALYHALRNPRTGAGDSLAKSTVAFVPPDSDHIESATRLRALFEQFVRAKCEIPESNVANIEKAYGDLFDSAAGGLVGGSRGRNNHSKLDNQAIFTTNYDASLEHYCIDCVRVSLNTGFQWDDVIGMKVSRPDNWRNLGYPKLFKLHGSVTWLNDPEYGLTEQRVVPRDMKKWTGSKFLGQVMLYPIEEKELYVEPYLTMFEQLNRELSSTRYWIVVGYSFADRFIRDIFMRNGTEGTRLALLHPHAIQIAQRLTGFKGKIVIQSSRFGESESINAYQFMINELRTG